MTSLISWQMIEPALQQILVAMIFAALGYLCNFLRKHTNLLQWQHDNGIKGQVYRDVVLFAQQTCADLTNSSKLTVAFEEARKRLNGYGINVTDDELKQSIEATLKQIKIEAGQQWSESGSSTGQ